VELVDRVVREAHAERQLGVLAHEGVEAPAEHVARHVGHARDVDVGLDRQLAGELDGPLRNVGRHVADAFQVGGILSAVVMRRRSRAAGWRRASNLKGEVVDLDIEAVHRVVALDGGRAPAPLALDEGPHRLPDLLLHEAAHLEDGGTELAELLLERPGRCGAASAEPSRDVVLGLRPGGVGEHALGRANSISRPR